jgi:hypothetical protein
LSSGSPYILIQNAYSYISAIMVRSYTYSYLQTKEYASFELYGNCENSNSQMRKKIAGIHSRESE